MDVNQNEVIIQKDLDDIFAENYANFSAAVITNRVIPSVVDGLIPSHRKILLGMSNNKSSSYEKAAMHVGYILGFLHPHGDLTLYNSLVRMSQPWVYPIPLIAAHGNNGSVTGSAFAAMRYLEVKLSNFTKDVYFDESYFNESIIDYEWNYNNKLRIPSVLPAKIPTILLNNTATIGTGFTGNLPCHNLNEVCNATLHMLDHPNSTLKDILKYIKGIDYPISAMVTNANDVEDTYTKGQGTFRMQGTFDIEKINGKESLVITSIPLNITVDKILNEISELSKDKDNKKRKEPGVLFNKISAVKDLTKGLKIRIAIFPKKDVSTDVLKHLLVKYTSMSNTIKYINNVLDINNDFIPNMPLMTMLNQWIENRIDVVKRKFIALVSKTLERITILKALIKANTNKDKILELLKKSKDKDEIKNKLISEFGFADKEAEYVVNQPLYKITSVEIQKIKDELTERSNEVEGYLKIVKSRELVVNVIKEEIKSIQNKYGKDQNRYVTMNNLSSKNDIINSIEEETILITFTTDNYIYSKSVDDIKNTNRATKGKNTIDRKNKVIMKSVVLGTRDKLLCFSDTGKMFILYGYQLNVNNVHINNIISTLNGSKIVSIIKLSNDEKIDDNYKLVFTTTSSFTKKCYLKDYLNRIPADGLLAVSLNEGESLINTVLSLSEDDLIVMTTRNGYSSKMPVSDLDLVNRTSKGRRKVRLKENDEISSLLLVDSKSEKNSKIVFATTNGKGKLVEVESLLFKKTVTGMSSAFLSIKLNPEDTLLRTLIVYPNEDLIINTSNGKMIRIDSNNINTYSRQAKGNNLIKLNDNDTVASIATVNKDSEE